MSSHDGNESTSNGSSSRPVPSALLGKKTLLGARSSEEARRNRLNMEKMILKNVSGARISTKNRGQQIVEALKKKRQQGDGAEDERANKKKKTAAVPSESSSARAVAAGILSPARRSSNVVAQKSVCFSTEGVASSLDVTPDGEIIIVGFTDGAVRLYEMDSSVPSDRHGYLLGHIDETSSKGYSSFHLRIKISPDGRYVFVGCRQGLRVVMTINLDQYRTEKEGDDDEFQQFQKHFYSQQRLRGFADVTTYVPPAEITELQGRKRSAYYVLTGLGVGCLNLWRFIEADRDQDEPTWDHLQNFVSGGNTATVGAFLVSSSSPGVLAIAAASKDKFLRVWPLEYKKSSSGLTGNNDDSASDVEEIDSLSGVHVVTTHFNIQNTSEIFAIHGQYAYSISLMGEAYRIRLPDAANIAGSEGERPPRQSFELEKLDRGGSGKSRRSNIMLESLSATDDGKAVVAVSAEGIVYYSNQLPDVGTSDDAVLRIIGKNASENTLFKAPMKVYTPMITSKGNKTKSESMMAVVTNPTAEDSDEYTGYFNVDPTEVLAARWMVPSRGKNCWVCGVRNVSHWSGPPPESKIKVLNTAALDAEKKAKAKAERRRQRALRQAEEAAARQLSSPETPTSVKTKSTPRSSAKKAAAQKKQQVQLNASVHGDSGPTVSRPSSTNSNKKRRTSHSNDDEDEDEDYTGSDDDNFVAVRAVPSAPAGPSVATLMNELEHFKKRNVEIKTEWQRRLQGERQLRRKWKQREDEFLEQLNDSLTKLDTAEVEVDRLKVLLRDAEKRFAFEKARVEQDNSVKARYEQLCEQMNEKMALVADQKRLLEQTTRSLLTEVDRNVHALKNAVVLEKSECVVCKDQQAVTAVVPCGHLCFCEQDAESFRRNCTSEYPTCPICQQEIVSLLRIY
ncbi:hypothetical protein BBJ29_004143 [Phytophthora kernoviae]|uniref:RING-type domain-containing protein n=1 Tax=Phytophthora kernoviae TaxID=325452 RepID=A0A421FML3_9STRA|nr:hypothetical protein BBJ29_004143 [Phytophthora kernoviae]